jgi:uncharacterized protein YegP (UPF0339 family)
MPDPVVLNKANPLSAAEDFNFLRLEGIKHIEKLAGNIWTDYNTHDPGITLLEALCYAITDLAYRTKFDMKDLVAPASLSADSWKNIFYTARRILPGNPVTLNDYRKMLIDIVGVRNAWITVSEDCEVPVYISYPDFDSVKNSFNASNPNPCGDEGKIPVKLAFVPDENAVTTDKIIELNGLYKIIIEFEKDIIEKKEKEKIRQKALRRLHSHRSLCEDYLSVTGAEYKDFSLSTEVVLKEDADADMVLAQICFRVQNYFTPNHKFYSLEELVQKGFYAEDIFEGPFLTHGFILDTELEKTDFFRDMRLSDIINSVADIDGIIALDIFKVYDSIPPDSNDACGNEQYFDEWIAGMKNEKLIGKLNVDDIKALANAQDKDATASTEKYTAPIKLYKSGSRVTINTDRFSKLLKDLEAFNRNNKLLGHSGDFEVPAGENMELNNFYPVQYELPETYKVGKEGLPMKAGNDRLVQALQLKGYLAVFEQLFLNYVSQLNNLNQIFSFNETAASYPAEKIIFKDNSTPPQLKESIAGYLHLYVDSERYISSVQGITEDERLFETRRNKMLDHLLARFSENFEDYDSIMKYLYPKDYLKKGLKNKTDFLADYPCISGNRARAYNYKLQAEGEDVQGDKDEELISKNISGLEQRIGRTIGMADVKRKTIAPENLFFIVTGAGNQKGRIRLYKTFEKTEENLLLESVEIDATCEDSVMHCFIDSACCGKNFVLFPEHKNLTRRIRNHASGFSFILIDHKGETIATSKVYTTKDERDAALKKVKEIMQQVCNTEGLHMIEHILLRPKGDDETDDESGNTPQNDTHELLDVCLDKCDLNVGANTAPLPVLYKFNIRKLKTEECIGNKKWEVSMIRMLDPARPSDPLNPVIFKKIFFKYGKLDEGNSGPGDNLLSASEFISMLREYGSDYSNYKVYKTNDATPKYFFRIFDEKGKLVIESETLYDNFLAASNSKVKAVTRAQFKKKDVSEEDRTGNPPFESLEVLMEIENLKAFLAYELDLYCCEDACDNNEDPYSFRISFALPCWPKRFRDKGFRRFVEKTIQSETPAHIHAKIYWLGIEQMRQYEDAYFEWLVEMACNDVPEISIVNDFIKAVKELKNCDEHCHKA